MTQAESQLVLTGDMKLIVSPQPSASSSVLAPDPAPAQIVITGNMTITVVRQPFLTAPAQASASASVLAPAPATAQATARSPAPAPAPAGIREQLMHKNRLQEYTQKADKPLPIYQSISEGFQHAQMFRSSVLVDGVTYTSRNCYSHRKAAEQDVAELALEYISKEIKGDDEGPLELVTVFCKSILNEFAAKLNLEKPTYNTVQPHGLLPVFTSYLVFNGVTYIGDVARNKKEAEQLAARATILSLLGNSESSTILSEIIKSKLKPFAALHKVKGSSFTKVSNMPMGVSTGQRSGVSLSKDNEVQVPVAPNNVPAVATPITSSGMLTPRHKFKRQKLEPSSQAINTVPPSQTIKPPIVVVPPVSQQPPIAVVPPVSQQPQIVVVPPVLQQPLDVGLSSAKQRRINRKLRQYLLSKDNEVQVVVAPNNASTVATPIGSSGMLPPPHEFKRQKLQPSSQEINTEPTSQTIKPPIAVVPPASQQPPIAVAPPASQQPPIAASPPASQQPLDVGPSFAKKHQMNKKLRPKDNEVQVAVAPNNASTVATPIGSSGMLPPCHEFKRQKLQPSSQEINKVPTSQKIKPPIAVVPPASQRSPIAVAPPASQQPPIAAVPPVLQQPLDVGASSAKKRQMNKKLRPMENEVQVAVAPNNASTVATPIGSLGMLPPRHEFKRQKLQPSSQEINAVPTSQTIKPPVAVAPPASQQPPIAVAPPASQQPPIAAVPPVLQQPLDVSPSSAKKRQMNKKLRPKDNEVQVAMAPNNASTVVTPIGSSGMLSPRHEFKMQKLQPSSQEINAVPTSQTIKPPIAVVPPASQQPPIAVVPPTSQQPPIAVEPPASQQPPIAIAPPASQQPPIAVAPPASQQPPIAVAPPASQQPPIVVAPPASQQPPIEVEPPVLQQPLKCRENQRSGFIDYGLIAWVPPCKGTVKLNTDGCTGNKESSSGAGGIFRDSSGNWLLGFHAHLGECNNIAAEMHAIRLGLEVAWSEGFRDIICECDATSVIWVLQKPAAALNPLAELIEDCRSLIARDWKCSLSHTLREGNGCADILSKMGKHDTSHSQLTILRECPERLLQLLDSDRRGVGIPRGLHGKKARKMRNIKRKRE